jgi:L-idonate 5-dehydrogenase
MALLTETVPLSEARAAFELAADRSRAMKVQLAFT